jgi:acyl carrier protein
MGIEERVRKIVVDHLGVSDHMVVDAATFRHDLGADSLDDVELTMAFEEEFRIEIPDDDCTKYISEGTFGGLCRYLESRRLNP